MKKKKLLRTLAVSTLCLSFSGALMAQTLDNIGVSQSYYVTESGRPVSVKSEVPADRSMWSTLFSPDGFFYQKELVKHFGSKYIILHVADQVHTIDSQGNFYKDIRQYYEGTLRTTGANYFITSKNIMYIVKSNGELVERAKKSDDPNFKKLAHAGGMFILPRGKGNIGIINPFTGDIDYKPFMLLSPIKHEGDNFAITDLAIDRKVYTVGFDEEFRSSFNELNLPDSVKSVKLTGGNFFIDQDNKIHTINDRGELSLEGTHVTGFEKEAPVAIGGNYMFFSDRSLYLVDEDGMVNYVDKINDDLLVTNR